MDYYDDELDLTSGKIKNLEVSIAELQDAIITLGNELKETQRFLIKLAQNQGEVTKRVTMWPYIAVPNDRGE